MVVDRLLVKPGIEKRLEASIETATKLANGLVLIAVVNGEERLYSQKLACTECGASVPQLEPRSFSFNSPYGACEACHGLGSKWTFDPAKVMADPSKPLLEGLCHRARLLLDGAEPEGRREAQQSQPLHALRSAAEKGAGRLMEAILEALNESYENAPTDAYREWLQEYMSPAPCPACKGKRLRPSSLAVRVKNLSIAEFTALPIARALVTVRNWEFSEREQQIAGAGGGGDPAAAGVSFGTSGSTI